MKNIRAYLAATGVVFIWSGWIAISRHGVQTVLQPLDITLFRYVTALLAVWPLAIRHQWRRFTLFQYLVVGLGVGFPYTLFSLYGLRVIRAAHAGVLVNGVLPILGALVALLLFHQKITRVRYLAIAIIFCANLLMAGRVGFLTGHGLGILFLLCAACFYTGHMTGIRLWGFTWRDVLVTVPVVNVPLLLPLLLLLPTAMGAAPLQEIFVQAVYQGVVVNVIAMTFVAYAIRHLGTISVSLFMSFVPVTTAILAWLLLGEMLHANEIAGIAGCSIGLLLYAGGDFRWTKAG